MAQTGLLLVPSDALGHTWALPGVLGGGQGLPPETGPEDLKRARKHRRSASASVNIPMFVRLRSWGPGVRVVFLREQQEVARVNCY